MNLTRAVPTATRGVFSKNVVIAYLPRVADGFIVDVVIRPIGPGFRENLHIDRLHEVTSPNRLAGISNFYRHLIIVRQCFILKPEFRGEKILSEQTNISHTHTHTHTHTYTRTHTRARAHTHTHTHTLKVAQLHIKMIYEARERKYYWYILWPADVFAWCPL